MEAFDEGNVFYSDQRGEARREVDNTSPLVIKIKYREFIRTFRLEEVHLYRDLLRQAISLNCPVLEVDMDHLMEYDDTIWCRLP